MRDDSIAYDIVSIRSYKDSLLEYIWSKLENDIKEGDKRKFSSRGEIILVYSAELLWKRLGKEVYRIIAERPTDITHKLQIHADKLCEEIIKENMSFEEQMQEAERLSDQAMRNEMRLRGMTQRVKISPDEHEDR